MNLVWTDLGNLCQYIQALRGLLDPYQGLVVVESAHGLDVGFHFEARSWLFRLYQGLVTVSCGVSLPSARLYKTQQSLQLQRRLQRRGRWESRL